MPNSAEESFAETMRAIRPNYLLRLKETMQHLALLREQWESGRITAAERKELFRLVHNLSGSGSSFGFSAISMTAHQLQQELLLPDPCRQTIASLIRTLEQNSETAITCPNEPPEQKQ